MFSNSDDNDDGGGGEQVDRDGGRVDPWVDRSGAGTSLQQLGRILTPGPNPVGHTRVAWNCSCDFSGADSLIGKVALRHGVSPNPRYGVGLLASLFKHGLGLVCLTDTQCKKRPKAWE